MQVILLVGTKLQVIITKMGLRIQERGEVVKGVPVVQLGDDLFWFNRPRLVLYLIHFVLFQNAFQLAFFAWTWVRKLIINCNLQIWHSYDEIVFTNLVFFGDFQYEFGFKSCFYAHTEDVVIRISMG